MTAEGYDLPELLSKLSSGNSSVVSKALKYLDNSPIDVDVLKRSGIVTKVETISKEHDSSPVRRDARRLKKFWKRELKNEQRRTKVQQPLENEDIDLSEDDWQSSTDGNHSEDSDYVMSDAGIDSDPDEEMPGLDDASPSDGDEVVDLDASFIVPKKRKKKGSKRGKKRARPTTETDEVVESPAKRRRLSPPPKVDVVKPPNSESSSVSDKSATVVSETPPSQSKKRGRKRRRPSKDDGSEGEKKHLKPLFAEDGSLAQNVSNFGLKKGQVAARLSKGEFGGLAIRSLENVRFQFNTKAMDEAVEMVNNGDDLQKVTARLDHTDPSTVLALIGKWYRDYVKGEVPDGPFAEALERDEARLEASLHHDEHAVPLYNGGYRKGKYVASCAYCRMQYRRWSILNFPFILESVPDWIPREWVGREFAHAWEFHRAVDGLPARIGKAPTTYAAYYNMHVMDHGGDWMDAVEMSRFLFARSLSPHTTVLVYYDESYALRVRVKVIDKFFDEIPDEEDVKIAEEDSDEERFAVYKGCEWKFRVLLGQARQYGDGKPIVIGIRNFLNDDVDAPKPEGWPGHYASQMQKSIRRGKRCQLALIEAIEGMLNSRIQHVANLQFAACSGVRQLVWRMFITTIEDSRPYSASPTDEYWPLSTLVALALIAQADPNFVLPKDLRVLVKQTALSIQASTESWDWRSKMGKKTAKLKLPNKKILDFELMDRDDAENEDEFMKSLDRDLIRCVINIMPCMRGDLELMLVTLANAKPKPLPAVTSINDISLKNLTWKPPDLLDDDGHNRNEGAGSTFLRNIIESEGGDGDRNHSERMGLDLMVRVADQPDRKEMDVDDEGDESRVFDVIHDDSGKATFVLEFTSQDLFARQAAIDMHCYPHIILFVQANLPVPPQKTESTFRIAGAIWDWVSGYNVRTPAHNKSPKSKRESMLLKTIHAVQRTMLLERNPDFETPEFPVLPPPVLVEDRTYNPPDAPPDTYRAAFIALLGKKFTVPRINTKKPALTITVAGTRAQPCMVQRGVRASTLKDGGYNPYQYLSGKERLIGEKRYIDILVEGITVPLPKPPPGLKWVFDAASVKVHARYIRDPCEGMEEFEPKQKGRKRKAKSARAPAKKKKKTKKKKSKSSKKRQKSKPKAASDDESELKPRRRRKKKSKPVEEEPMDLDIPVGDDVDVADEIVNELDALLGMGEVPAEPKRVLPDIFDPNASESDDGIDDYKLDVDASLTQIVANINKDLDAMDVDENENKDDAKAEFEEKSDSLSTSSPSPEEEKRRLSLTAANLEDDSEPNIIFTIEGIDVDPFDSRPILHTTGEVHVVDLVGWPRHLIAKAFYAVSEQDEECEVLEDLIDEFGTLIPVLEIGAYMHRAEMRRKTHDDIPVFDWYSIAKHSALGPNVWRDVLTKILTQEAQNVDVAAVSREGKRQLVAIRYETEGTCLRLLHALAFLYPTVLRNQGRLRFRLSAGSTHYVHLIDMLRKVSFMNEDSKAEATRIAMKKAKGRKRKPVVVESESESEAASDWDETDEDDSEMSGDDSDSSDVVPTRRSARLRKKNGQKKRTTKKKKKRRKPVKRKSRRRKSNRAKESESATEVSPSVPKSDAEYHREILDGLNIKTKLWEHQHKTAERVLRGVQQGKRGFADASAVGAGKTLSALATFVRLLKRQMSQGVACHGALVLLPNIRLIAEWKDQISKHIEGLSVCWQESNGRIEPDPSLLHAPHSVVITTLGRARDHPFGKQWTLVIVDECTSVQNESALQTAEAWRQVVSSDTGVLMLSATFFRSRFSKLFYMIRMLGSPIPREGGFLNAILAEHIICHVPEVRRTWHTDYVAVPLLKKVREKYEHLRSSQRGLMDSKLLFMQLQQLLRNEFDPIPHIKEQTMGLLESGRRPLIFANTIAEKEKVMEAWGDGGVPKSVHVVTVHEAAFGLNMQHDCDCIVTRPHPGDIMEQMKGRIDRPGQREDELYLKIVFAKDTLEAAQAANVRICGQFMRQYLDPLSERFQEIALEDGAVESIIAGFDQILGDDKLSMQSTSKAKRHKNPKKGPLKGKVKRDGPPPKKKVRLSRREKKKVDDGSGSEDDFEVRVFDMFEKYDRQKKRSNREIREEFDDWRSEKGLEVSLINSHISALRKRNRLITRVSWRNAVEDWLTIVSQ